MEKLIAQSRRSLGTPTDEGALRGFKGGQPTPLFLVANAAIVNDALELRAGAQLETGSTLGMKAGLSVVGVVGVALDMVASYNESVL